MKCNKTVSRCQFSELEQFLDLTMIFNTNPLEIYTKGMFHTIIDRFHTIIPLTGPRWVRGGVHPPLTIFNTSAVYDDTQLPRQS